MGPRNASLSRTTVIMHGRLADILGRDVEIAVPPHCSIAGLRRRIAAEHPDAAEAMLSGRVRVCVADAIVSDRYRLAPGDTVEFLPPVSGG